MSEHVTIDSELNPKIKDITGIASFGERNATQALVPQTSFITPQANHDIERSRGK